ncbi:MAG: SdrD B-like domain-containing protein, partial [Acidimicrobiales bacterium]
MQSLEGCQALLFAIQRSHPFRALLYAALCVLLIAAGLTLRGFTPAAASTTQTCWAVADSGSPHTSNDLLTQIVNGVETRIDGGASSTDGTGTTAIEAIAFHPVDSRLYATNAGTFGEINTTTGEFNSIGATGFSDVDGLSFDPFTLILYGSARVGGDDLLFQIDPTTGAAITGAMGGSTSVPILATAAVGLGDIDDLAVSPYDGQMYGIANSGASNDRLVQIDKVTGAVTDVGPTNPAVDVEGLSFDGLGQLLGTTGFGAALWDFNVNTGASSNQLNLTYGDYESLECDTNGWNLLSGSVFLDRDLDATFTGADTGAAGANVTLYRDVDLDGTVSFGDIALATNTTAGDGSYSFPVGATGSFVLEVDTATLPPAHSFTTDNLEVAAFATSFGGSDTGNDFGFTMPPDLSVLKSSDAPADLEPGDRIEYTIVVTNTAATSQTGVTVSDVLPTGTTYVSGSTTATFSTSSAATFTDDFESNSFTGGTGAWTSNWLEIGESNGPNSGDIRTMTDGGDRSLRVRDNDNGGEGVRRNLDLSGFTTASLTFDYRPSGLDNSNDRISVDVLDSNGTTWTEIAFFEGPLSSSTYSSLTLSLDTHLHSTAIRFLTSSTTGGADAVFFDNVVVNASTAGTTTLSNAPAAPNPLVDGDPSNLVVSGDAISLAPGGSVTVTFQVDVVNPTTETQIVNTASASSVQSTAASGTVIDPLTSSTLGDTVWEDLDADGIQDSGEPGISGVTVNLLNSGGTQISSTTTNGSGGYSFAGLGSGQYIVEVIEPVGYEASAQNVGGDDTIDSDVATANGRTGLVSVGTGVAITHVDAGLFRRASVSDFVWEDDNGNGIQDSGEAGLDGVTVNLLNSGGSQIASTTTAGGGNYGFGNLVPGTYTVQIVFPAGMVATTPNAGGDDTIDSDIDNGGEAATSLTSGESDTTIDGGLYTPVSIGNFVWDDLDADGVQDAGEPGLDGVTVNLLDLLGVSVVATTTTASGGAYAFTGLAPGSYVVEVIAPSGMTITVANVGGDDTVDSDADGSGRSPITLSSGDIDRTIDTGLFASTSVGDFVWDDLDGDGIQDAGEPGLDGITINLLDATGTTTLATTTTASGGAYSFTGLVPGTYTVQVVVPSGMVATTVDAGGDDTIDSDLDGSGEATTTLISGENDTSIDGGLYTPATIGNFVWDDLNANGIQNAGEPGLDGITINLLNAAGTITLASTTTAGGGSYSFTGLAPGTYAVQVVTPAGMTITAVDSGGNDAIDSDIDGSGEVVATVVSGQNDNTIDGGLFTAASVGDFVWDDLNANGIQDVGEPGVDGVTVTLLDATGTTTIATTTTAGGGAYIFSGIVPATYTVRVSAPSGYIATTANAGGDDTIDSDVNASGEVVTTLISNETDSTIDAGFFAPPAIGNLVWDDLDGDGIQDPGEPGLDGITVNLLDPTGTSVLMTTTTSAGGSYGFTGLTPGSYRIGVVLPAGLVVTIQDAGVLDNIDSDIDVSGVSPVVTLVSNEVNNTIDGGLFTPASVSDFVWDDLNANGIQDPGEPGLDGITVNLLDATGTTTLATTTTASGGAYSFTGLAPGDYTVQIVAPAGMIITTADAGGDDNIDSDIDGSGEVSATLISGEDDTSVDAGLFSPPAIGDRVWDDLNADGVQDPGEPGLDGITVNLLNAAGTATLATTTTAGGGLYGFTSLTPGSYRIEVVIPAGRIASPQNSGGDDTVDSDIDASGETAIVTVASGDVDNSVDGGLYSLTSVSDFVWDDLDANGIQDPGEPGLDGITVNLLNAGGATIATTTTAGGGAYGFSNLIPGDYTVQVIAPAGMSITTADAGGNDAIDSDIDGSGEVDTTLTSGENDNTIDAGLWTAASVSDFVWDDLNANGIQDGGEPGLDGITVNLLDATGTTTLATTTTASGGAYSFTGLTPATYTVQVIAPPGTIITAANVGGDDTIDSDIDGSGEVLATVISGENDNTIDAGLYTRVSISDFVWDDLDANGIQDPGEPGLAGITVNLL